ncbi:hypothetical protein N7535_005281 [Penicillium sp. DV-2018c]|nr:hypothetical protein N7461_008861 [Penicillium sp. DV-2018c]KAJ5571621.1 hypothetical protein N7535_005281 [Penicillium sp. DV-2018c]
MLNQYPPRRRLTRLDGKRGPFISASPSPESPPMASPSSPRSSTESPQTASHEHPPTYLSSPIEETLHLKDLELMIHWCTTTCKTMARGPSAERLWQITIPQLSLRYPSLRQGLLALSALHLASTSTPSLRRRYLERARAHQANALSGLRIDSEDAPESQSQATFALCCIMIVFPFGYRHVESEMTPDSDAEHRDTLDEFFEVFQLTRWLVNIMMKSADRIAGSELNPLVEREDPPATMPDMSRLVVFSLLQQNGMEAMRDTTHEKKIYDAAIEHLSNALKQLMKGGEPHAFAFYWCFRIPEEFLELLEARRPFALVVIAHYAVILHHLRDEWWMGDWGAQILKEIGDLLEPQWQELISWPIDATGCFLPRVEVRARVIPTVSPLEV